MRLFIDNKECDLFVDAEIALTKQVANAIDLDSRQLDFTNRFELPLTPNNLSIMEHLTVPGNTSKRPYKFAPARLETTGGIVYADKLLAIVDDVTDVIEVRLLGDVFDFASVLKGKQLNELVVPGTEHTLTAQLFKDRQSVIVDHTYPTTKTTGNPESLLAIFADTTYPAIFTRSVLTALVEENFDDFTSAGDWSGEDEFLNDLMLCTNVQSEAWKDYERVVLEQNNPFISTIADPQDSFSWITFDTIQDEKGRVFVVFPFDPPLSEIRFDVGRKIRAIVKGTLIVDRAAGILRIRKKPRSQNEPTINDEILAESEIAISATGEDFLEIDGEFEFEIGEDEDVYVSVSHEFLGSGADRYFEAKDVTVRFEMIENRLFNDTFDPRRYFADVTQYEFFTDIVKRFGLVYTFTPDNKIRLESFADIFDGKFGIEDWSNKLILDDRPTESYEYGTYGKKSIFGFDGESESNQVVIFDNDNYEDVDEVVTTKATGLSLTEQGLVDVGEFFEGDVNFYLRGDSNLYFVRRRRETELPPRRVIRLRPQDSTGISLDSSSGQIFSDLPMFDVEKFYGKLLPSIERPTVLTATIFLTEVEFYNLDFYKLKYFEQYQANFYLLKAENYIPGQPLKCQFLKVKSE